MSEDQANPAPQAPAMDPNAPIFAPQNIYIKDASYEAPNGPNINFGNTQPQMNMEMKLKPQQLAEGFHEVVLEFRLEAKVNDTVVYLVEVQQAGLFVIRNVPADDMRKLIGVGAPNFLLPYARQAISDLIIKGGFPPFLLPAMDFAAMLEAQERQAAMGEGATNPSPVVN
jgi:preprotein translocase subunit SecB